MLGFAVSESKYDKYAMTFYNKFHRAKWWEANYSDEEKYLKWGQILPWQTITHIRLLNLFIFIVCGSFIKCKLNWF